MPLDFVRFRNITPPLGLWEESFGPYLWFYAPFIGEYLHQVRIGTQEIYKFYKERQNKYDNTIRRMSFWGRDESISLVQMRSVVMGKLTRLDKAAITIIVAIDASQEAGQRASAFMPHHFYIAGLENAIIPSTFVVDREGGALDSSEHRREIAEQIGQSALLMEDVMRGNAVIEPIADDVVQAVRKSGIGRARTRLLASRRDDYIGRRVRPSAYQALDLEKIRDFYK